MRLPRRPSAVLFDLDGVLLDTEPLYTLAANRVLEAFGAAFDWELKAQTMGRDPVEGARRTVARFGLPITAEEFLERRQPHLEALLRDAPERDGAKAFFGAVTGRGTPHAIATSSDRRIFGLKIAGKAWLEGVSIVVCGDDAEVRRKKPAPDIFLAAARRLGVAPETCLVFEDSPSGVEAALAAGMLVVALPDPHLDEALVADAHWVARGFGEITREAIGL